jgi:2-dehydro-3-deoxygluconokinase
MSKSFRYALLVPTSMGVRLTPFNGQPTHLGGNYSLQATSAETNVASIVSSLGMPVKVLTAFVKGHPFAAFIKSNLRGRGMCVEGPEREQGGPWGYRHQINIADSGSGSRGPRVWNDRAGEVGRSLKADDFDLKRIFEDEGVRRVHLSGLIAAIAPEFCLDVVRMAVHSGSSVSFDLNYRASFWKGHEDEYRKVFAEIASAADVLIGNEEDFQLCLGIEGPASGGTDLEAKTEQFTRMIGRVRESYPGARVIATTLREVKDANTHLWGAIVADGGEGAVVIPPREIHVLDRIGGGDGFTGGLLYGLLKGWSIEKCAQFGWASGALATTMLTDYALPADEEQIWSIWNGNARVKR